MELHEQDISGSLTNSDNISLQAGTARHSDKMICLGGFYKEINNFMDYICLQEGTNN